MSIEWISDPIPDGRVRCVLFDFDGTISLIRQGWQDVMLPMMVEVLADLKTERSENQIGEIVREFVDRLTGRQTIYQMIRLCEIIEEWGGGRRDPRVYKKQFNERLLAHIANRKEALRTRAADPGEWTLPGVYELLDNLSARGFGLYLASGTDVADVKEEAQLLGVVRYFGANIYGALDDHEKFSKALLIRDLLAEHHLKPGELLGFGDGYVEIENVKAAAGIAVGVASDEKACLTVDTWKRDRLIGAGADVIIPNYLEQETLVSRLCDGAP